MGDFPAQRAVQKKDWSLTAHVFHRLLTWLDEGTNSDGQRYLEMRRRLVVYFDRKNCSAPDELADETLNRVARRLDEEDVIESETPARYCYIVARFVFMEHLRGAQQANALRDEMWRASLGNDLVLSGADNDQGIKDKMLNCLEQCGDKLEPLNRVVIIRYYFGKGRVKIENRRALAEELGITQNALTIRACRIRDKLEDCVRRCVGPE